ncbi:hypothetical protein PoB_001503800 [Plakobranchus ocellatus]|uniref:Uncharacterized protein n=1 Tax=Plakobranchus ocellatus TaxID=259542 RepID=A0AAV3Z182_9GAST|nr:hypothetical protein PoB_001503800 [Plakobranchus ocellatus]
MFDNGPNLLVRDSKDLPRRMNSSTPPVCKDIVKATTPYTLRNVLLKAENPHIALLNYRANPSRTFTLQANSSWVEN